jgi:YD repeat-containing protein
VSIVDDMVIEHLALSEAELLERVASLEADVAIYQELTCAAFDALHDLTVSRDREREQHQRVCDEYRALREHVMLQAGADDPEDVVAA